MKKERLIENAAFTVLRIGGRYQVIRTFYAGTVEVSHWWTIDANKPEQVLVQVKKTKEMI